MPEYRAAYLEKGLHPSPIVFMGTLTQFPEMVWGQKTRPAKRRALSYIETKDAFSVLYSFSHL